MSIKKILGTLVIVITLFVVWLFLKNDTKPLPVNVVLFDPLNTSYVVDGSSVTLVNGKAETSVAPGSASKMVTTVFGPPLSTDLNNDGKKDAVVILTQNAGGSGTFYYVATAINTGAGASGTNALLLGDRIVPQNTEVNNNQIVVNYADRKADKPMSTVPSVGVTTYAQLNGTTVEIARKIVGGGERCGGNMTTTPRCVDGYHCAPEPLSHLPFGDVGGICVKN